MLAQYTKDLSFENPNAPASLGPQPQQPSINIQINVNANNVAENEYEVALLIEGKAENGGKVMFSFDLSYAGVFRIVNVPKENLHPLIMIECPRLLFPFAREIIATAVRDGGFPPLMLDPVDFVGLYRQNMERQAAAAQAAQVSRAAGSEAGRSSDIGELKRRRPTDCFRNETDQARRGNRSRSACRPAWRQRPGARGDLPR